MTSYSTSAPGKLVIAGEYAVLENQPGLSIAISKRAYVKPSASFKTFPSAKGSQNSLIECTIQTAQELGLENKKLDCSIDSYELYHHHDLEKSKKLGLGSSAAVAAALAMQFFPQSANINHDAIFQLAYLAHKKFNQGKGSGIDVATCVYGGLIRFQKTSANHLPAIQPLQLKIDPKSMICVFTKKSQSTRHFLEKVQIFKACSPQEYDSLMKELGQIAKSLEQVLCQKPDWNQLVLLIKENLKILHKLGEKSDIDLVTKEHRQIAQTAVDHGGMAKPSGAGGGDIALCFVPLEHQASFLKEIHYLGFYKLELDFLAPGVQIKP